MLKVDSKEPTKSGIELAEHNIMNLCRTKNYGTTSQACLAWLKLNKESTFYDLEKFARNNKLDLYFIASNKIDNGTKISLPNHVDDTTLKYKCILSCANKEDALKQIHEESTDYIENAKKLKETGFLIPINSTFKELLKETKESKELHHIIMHNKIEMNIAEVDPLDELKADLQNAKNNFKQTPKSMLIASTERKKSDSEDKDDSSSDDERFTVHAFAVTIEDKQQIISQYGIMKSNKTNDQGKKKQAVILINDKKTWNYDKLV
jgi:hypothetical protein